METQLDLSGVWKAHAVEQFSEKYRHPDFRDNDWIDVHIPGHWQQTPALQTTTGQVVFRKSFSFSPDSDGFYQLHFDGVFYAATVYLNGKCLGTHEGYFSPFSFGISKTAQTENVLVVEVSCLPPRRDGDETQLLGIFRHPHYFQPDFNPGGIWRPVYITRMERLAWHQLFMTTRQIQDETATIDLRLQINALVETAAQLQFEMTPANFDGDTFSWQEPAQLTKGRNTLNLTHTLDKPGLWWTHDRGFPACYKLTTTVRDEQTEMSISRLVGVRTIYYEKNRLYLNNQSCFLRGANYLPTRPYLADSTVEICEQDITRAVKTHLNCLRIHTHVAPAAIYEACTRQGVLLWQDLPLSGLISRRAADAASKQIRQLIEQVGSYPCVGFFCCHDDPRPRFSRSKKRWRRILNFFARHVGNWNRNVLDGRLRKTACKLTSGHVIVRSSGVWGMLGSLSDVHFDWYSERDWFKKLPWAARFLTSRNQIISNFGATSQANPPEMPEGDMDQHLDVEISQKKQAYLLKFFIEKLRLRKYRPIIGFFLADFVDVWDRGGPGLLDAQRRPKIAWDIVRDALRPSILIASEVGQNQYRLGDVVLTPIYLINDDPRPFPQAQVNIKVKLERQLFLETTIMSDLKPDTGAVQIDTVFFRPQQPGTHHLWLGLLNREGEDDLYSSYELPVI